MAQTSPQTFADKLVDQLKDDSSVTTPRTCTLTMPGLPPEETFSTLVKTPLHFCNTCTFYQASIPLSSLFSGLHPYQCSHCYGHRVDSLHQSQQWQLANDDQYSSNHLYIVPVPSSMTAMLTGAVSAGRPILRSWLLLGWCSASATRFWYARWFIWQQSTTSLPAVSGIISQHCLNLLSTLLSSGTAIAPLIHYTFYFSRISTTGSVALSLSFYDAWKRKFEDCSHCVHSSRFWPLLHRLSRNRIKCSFKQSINFGNNQLPLHPTSLDLSPSSSREVGHIIMRLITQPPLNPYTTGPSSGLPNSLFHARSQVSDAISH